jgi:hypothetical protein
MKAGYGFENPHTESMFFRFCCLLAFLPSLVYVCHHRFGFVLPLSWARLLLLCTSSSFPMAPTEEVEEFQSFCSALILVLPLCWALLVLAAIAVDLVVFVLLTSAQVVCVLPLNWASLMLAATFHLLRTPPAFLACCRHHRLRL